MRHKRPEVGDRVRMTGIMKADGWPGGVDPAPIPVGEEGVVTWVNEGTMITSGGQYGVEWDSGRTLMLLADDPFEIVESGP